MLRLFLRHSIPALALLIAGIVVFAVGNGTTLWFVVGLAMVGLADEWLAIGSQFFYEVGRSEDRARAREQARGRRR